MFPRNILNNGFFSSIFAVNLHSRGSNQRHKPAREETRTSTFAVSYCDICFTQLKGESVQSFIISSLQINRSQLWQQQKVQLDFQLSQKVH